MASALPVPLAAGAMSSWTRLLPGLVGLNGRLRVFLEEYRGQLRSSALVYDGTRPELVVLILAALQQPGGADSAFRLLSGISGAAARAGMHRIFAAVPDEVLARETFFQAGFYSYTRETWYVAGRTAVMPPSQQIPAHEAFHAAAPERAVIIPAALAGIAGAVLGQHDSARVRSRTVLPFERIAARRMR